MDTNQPRSNPENGMKPLAIPVPEMARLLGISPKKAYQLVKQPNFPATKLDGRILVSVQGLERWFNEQMPTLDEGPNMGTHTEFSAEQPLAVTLPELARQLGIPRKQARELVEAGAFPTFQMDGKVHVLKRDLEAYVLRLIQALGIASPSGLNSKGGE